MKKNNAPFLSKVSFWTIFLITLVYATSIVLSILEIEAWIIGTLNSISTGLLVLIAAFHGWQYVTSKAILYKIVYIICLAVVIAGIVVPMVI